MVFDNVSMYSVNCTHGTVQPHEVNDHNVYSL